MNNDLLKTKEQLIIELESLRKISKQKEDELVVFSQLVEQRNQELKESNTQYKLLFEESNDAILLCNFTDKFIVDANKKAIQLLGFTKKELLAKRFLDLYTKEELDKILHLFNKEQETKNFEIQYESKFVTLRGEIKDINVKSKLIDKKNGIVQAIIRDITEEKKAEDALNKSRNLLLEVQDIAHISHWTYNPKTAVSWWSEELYKIYGLDPGNGPLSYEEHPRLIHPDDWEWFDATVKETIISGKPYDIVLRILRPSGEVRYVNSICKPLLDVNGVVVEMRGTVQDITERKEYEKKIERHEKRLKEAQQIAALGNYEYNIETGEHWWSEELYHILEFDVNKQAPSIEEFLIRLDEEDAVNLNRLIQNVISTGKNDSLIYKIKMPSSGTYKYIKTKAEFYTNELTKAKFIKGTFQDITERILSEKKIEASEKQFRALFQQTGDYCMIMDPNTDSGVPIIANLNESFAKALGGIREDFIGQSVAIIDDPKAKEVCLDRAQRLLEGEDLFTETTHVRKDGSTFDVAVRANLINIEGQKTLVFVTEHDITERKKTELALKQSEEKFRELYNQSPVAIQYYDSKGNLLDVNKKTLELYGIESVDEIAAYNFLDNNELSPDYIQDLKKGKSIYISDVLDFETIKKHKYFKTERTGVLYVEMYVAPVQNEGRTIAYLVHMLDVTEQKQANDKLKASEEKFRGVFEESNVGIAIGSAHGDVVEVNDEYLKITGYTRKEFVNLNFADITHPIDLEKELLLFEQLHNGEIDNYRIEKRLRAKSGAYVWLDSAISARKDADGNTNQTLAVVVDVTEGKKATETVNVFFEQPMNIHFIGTIEGDITKVNKGWEKILGYTKEESLGKNIFEFVHPDDKASTLNELSKLKNGKTTFYFENRYKHKNGTYVTLAWSAIFNTTGKMLHGIAKNITQQKAYHKQLVQSEERYKALSENAKHIILTHNFDGEISYVNQFGLDFINLPKEQVIGTDIKSMIQDEEELEKMQQRINDFILGSFKVHQFILDIVLPSGDEKILEVIGSPIRLNGKINSLLLTAYDITEREKERLELADSETKLKNIIENSTNLFYSYSVDNKITFISPQVKKILGYEPVEVMKHWTEYTTDNPINKKAKEYAQKVIDTARRQPTYEMEMQRKDGNKIIVEVREAPVVVNGEVKSIVGSLADITKRKKAEIKLRESEEKLRLAIDNSPLGISTNDMKGNFISVNKAYEKIVGYSKQELQGMSFFDITHPDYLPKNREFFDNISTNMASGFSFEKKYIHKNGNPIDVRINAGSIYDEYGKPLFSMAFTEDITKEKLARKELQKLYNELKVIYENDPTFIIFKDTKNNILHVSDSVAQMTGLPKKEIEGKPSKEIYPDMADKYYQDDLQVMQSGKAKLGIVEALPTADGQTKWLLTNKIPYLNKNNQLKGIILFSTDITDLKRSEERFRRAEKIGKVGNWEYDVRSKTFWASDEAKVLYGFNPEQEVITLEEAENRIPESKRTNKALIDLIEKDIPYKLDFDIVILETGEKRSLHSVAVAVKNSQGKTIKVRGVNQDITERVKFETELKYAKEKAEESDRLKSAFLSNMSHEIRTPMNGILGFTNLLKKPNLTGDTRDKFIQIIEKSGNRMLNTINDIVDISKIEAGQVEVLKEEFSVNKLLNEQFDFFIREAEDKGLKLLYKQIVSDSELRIISDLHKLESILGNLIKNAIKYTEFGSVTFGYAIKSAQGIDICEFYVTDTGIGISENRIDAIFNRFEQADIEDTRALEGSGLGLAISKSYIEMLGGTISVSSKENKGSSFTFNIPYIKPDMKERNAKQKCQKKIELGIKKLSIIVAEDDNFSKMFLETVLENECSKIIYTTTGKETIDRCRENPDIDIILMDIKMPDMNGYNATKEIRKFNQNVIIIAQTAFGLAGDKEKAIKVGCDDYISKPIKKESLLEKIQFCLNKKSN